MSDDIQTTKKPALNIFARSYEPNETSKIGYQIGVAWEFEGGYNIVLDTLPHPRNGKIEIVAFAPKS